MFGYLITQLSEKNTEKSLNICIYYNRPFSHFVVWPSLSGKHKEVGKHTE